MENLIYGVLVAILLAFVAGQNDQPMTTYQFVVCALLYSIFLAIKD